MESLIRRIKDNEPSLTELDFSRIAPVVDHDTLPDLLKALRESSRHQSDKSNITSVNLILRFLHKLDDREKFELCQALGSCLPVFKLPSTSDYEYKRICGYIGSP